MRRGRRGQAITEFAIMYAGVILPLTFMTIFVSQALWIWHGVNEWTRDGARYAATNCYDADAVNRRDHVYADARAADDRPGAVPDGRDGGRSWMQWQRAGVRRVRAGHGERQRRPTTRSAGLPDT